MPVFDLGKILEEIHWEEYAEFDDPPHSEPSPEFKRKMQKLFGREPDAADDTDDRNNGQ